jgi:hypothetical protein
MVDLGSGRGTVKTQGVRSFATDSRGYASLLLSRDSGIGHSV